MTTTILSEQAVVTNQNGQAQPTSLLNGTAPGLTNGAANGRHPDALVLEDWVSEDGHYVSEALYWEKYYHHPYFNYEWNNGILEEKPVSVYIQFSSYDWFNDLMREFLEVNPIARKMALEMGFRLEMANKVTIRKPDLFIVRHDNPIALGDTEHTYGGICDLCIESLSDSTQKEVNRDTVTKKDEYSAVGVREYYILDPSGVHQHFYRLNAEGKYDEIDAGPEKIIRSEVLPGFQFRIADLTRKPRLTELIDDDVYRGFILPEYQAERTRAEEERRRAEQERTRAEQERTRADRLAAKLRALGISEDEL